MDCQVVIVSGLSGSGKSVALKQLEDSGYFCIDNLPAPLLCSAEQVLQKEGYRRIAISVDVRSATNLAAFPAALSALQAQGVDVCLLFLDAKTDTLMKRFSETRRRHPLSNQTLTVQECIALERNMLQDIADKAHHLDTSDLSANALRTWVKQVVTLDASRFTLIFQSFGFKHGIPLDADFVFDTRCLPNPYYDVKLKPLTGLDAPVQTFLENEKSVSEYYGDIYTFLQRWLPRFDAENRSYLTVAIGCTGGQHRSVFLAEKLAAAFAPQRQVLVRHREHPW
jgi:UPF0042 nucleotide-binding protein